MDVAQEHYHGTRAGYGYYDCRCGPCCDAMSQWMREYYRRTEGLTKMVKTGEPMKRGSQGGKGSRGPQRNVARRLTVEAQSRANAKKRKPTAVDFEPDDGS